MTIDELVKEAAKLGGWRNIGSVLVRRLREDGFEECPITAVANARDLGFYQTGSWAFAAQALGLERSRVVMDAADGNNLVDGDRRYWRQRMLEEFGLPVLEGR